MPRSRAELLKLHRSAVQAVAPRRSHLERCRVATIATTSVGGGGSPQRHVESSRTLKHDHPFPPRPARVDHSHHGQSAAAAPGFEADDSQSWAC
jgi:hypothetical protein